MTTDKPPDPKPTADDDELIENAAACAQFRPLSQGDENEDESLRECIKLNVCKPLRSEIRALSTRLKAAEEERDHLQSHAKSHDVVDESNRQTIDALRAQLSKAEAVVEEARHLVGSCVTGRTTHRPTKRVVNLCAVAIQDYDSTKEGGT